MLPQEEGFREDKGSESFEAGTKAESQQLLEYLEQGKLLKKFDSQRDIGVQELSKFYVDSSGYMIFSLVYIVC